MLGYESYQQNSIQSASREDILVMLIEGAIIRIKQAREKWTKGNSIRARELRSQALAIITELDNTLDRENGDPELVDQLDALYAYMIRAFNNSALNDNFECLLPVQEVLESLLEAWQEAAKEFKKIKKTLEEQGCYQQKTSGDALQVQKIS